MVTGVRSSPLRLFWVLIVAGTNVSSSFTNVTTSGSGTVVSTPITNVTTGRNGTTVTTPAGEVVNVSGNGTNISNLTPADCRAWSRTDPCRADVDPYFRTVSSNTTDDATKDRAVEDFCSTECGTRYTARISGLVSVSQARHPLSSQPAHPLGTRIVMFVSLLALCCRASVRT